MTVWLRLLREMYTGCAEGLAWAMLQWARAQRLPVEQGLVSVLADASRNHHRGSLSAKQCETLGGHSAQQSRYPET
jgi:hypothetical protein